MRRWTGIVAASCAALAVVVGLAACGGDDGESGTTGGGDVSELTVYSGRSEDLVAPLFERFTDETGIELSVRYGDTAEMAATVVEEGDRSPADVFFGQDGGALGSLEAEGLLAPLPEDTLSPVPAAFRSPDGRWVGTSGRVRVLGYDTRVLDEADLPASVFDLTDERWSGRVGWAPTNASFIAFVTAMRAEVGDEVTETWLRDMQANGAVAFERNGVLRDAIANGEVEVGLLNHYYIAQARAELADPDSYPVGTHYFPGGDVGSLINVAGAGVITATDKQEAAEQLIAYLLSPESQEFFVEETKEYPVVEGIDGPAGLPPLSSIEQPDINLNELSDLRGTLALIEQAGIL
ncbi:MAG: iron ABC transporter substrate-binding protein [Thermoleophilia bacterium]|jgi:iron(III) transport system substrate-binding protein